jgi:hypothetical protein
MRETESAQQRAYRDEYGRLRRRVAELTRAVERQAPASLQFTTALEELCTAANLLCAEAEVMPTKMDEKAHAVSRRIVRVGGCITAVVVVVTAALIRSDVLGFGWWAGFAALAVAAGLLLLGPVEPPGRPGHRARRVPALISPTLAVVGLGVAGATPWWWAALLVMSGSLLAAKAAIPDGPGSTEHEQGGRR